MAVIPEKMLDALFKAKLLTLKATDPLKYAKEKNEFITDIFIPGVKKTLEGKTKKEISILKEYEELNLELLNKRIEIITKELEAKE